MTRMALLAMVLTNHRRSLALWVVCCVPGERIHAVKGKRFQDGKDLVWILVALLPECVIYELPD